MAMDIDPVREHWIRSAQALRGEPGTTEPWEALTTEPAGVTNREADADGVPVLWVEPAGADDEAVILYLHGGGFVSGSVWTHRKLAGHIAAAAGVRALLPDYRLLPANAYPDQLDDVTRAYTWLLGQGIRPERIVIAGDSCGGWLTLALALRARALDLPLPAGLAYISAWIDLTQSGAGYRTNAGLDPYFAKETVDALAAAYLGPVAATDPRVDLLQADLTGLPPMYLQAGADETLVDDSRALHGMAAKAGVESRLDVFPGQLHTFQMAAGHTPEADRAIALLASWLRPHLGKA